MILMVPLVSIRVRATPPVWLAKVPTGPLSSSYSAYLTTRKTTFFIYIYMYLPTPQSFLLTNFAYLLHIVVGKGRQEHVLV